MTITRQDAVLPFRIVAVITAIPGDLATILLNAFTLAILGSDDVNTGSSVVMLGRSMIFTCLRVFGAILICLRLKRILDAHGVTVTLQVRVVVVLLKKKKAFLLDLNGNCGVSYVFPGKFTACVRIPGVYRYNIAVAALKGHGFIGDSINSQLGILG